MGWCCCRNCILLDDTFARSNTVLPDGSIVIGSAWRTLAGTPRIQSNQLAINYGGGSAALAWLGGFPTPLGSFAISFASIADGTVFRVYLCAAGTTSVPSNNYVEYTYRSPGSGAQSSVTVNADTTTTYSWTEASDTPTLTLCVGQTGSTYFLALGNGAGGGYGGTTAAQASITPAGTNVIMQAVSSTADIVISSVLATTPGGIFNALINSASTDWTDCPGCDSTCDCSETFHLTIADMPAALAAWDGVYSISFLSTSPGGSSQYNQCAALISLPEDGSSLPLGAGLLVGWHYDPFTSETILQGAIVGYGGTVGTGEGILFETTIAGAVDCSEFDGAALAYKWGTGFSGVAFPSTDFADTTIMLATA